MTGPAIASGVWLLGIPEALPYIQFLGQVALIAAATFAGYQLVLHRRERHEQAALEILTHLQGDHFQRAYMHVWELPLACTAQEIHDRGAKMEHAVETVALTFESLGVMVHNRIVPLHVVDEVIGGFLRESWRRLEPYVRWKRRKLHAPRWAEWYEWLAVQVDAGRRRRTTPAYEAFKQWRE